MKHRSTVQALAWAPLLAAVAGAALLAAGGDDAGPRQPGGAGEVAPAPAPAPERAAERPAALR